MTLSALPVTPSKTSTAPTLCPRASFPVPVTITLRYAHKSIFNELERFSDLTPQQHFWQNVSSAVGCDGGALDCMRGIDFDTLTSAADDVVDTYTYQMQPRVDGDIIADTCKSLLALFLLPRLPTQNTDEAQFYQKRVNFDGPVVISHEQHEANGQAYDGVNTSADVATYLRIFFPAIADDVVDELLELYPESDYTSPGLRFSDMKQSFDLTCKNLALTQYLKNNTWNAMVALDQATHGTDQSYYWYSTYSLSSSDSSSTTTTSSNSTSSGAPSGMGGGMGGSSSVNATVAVAMQKYLLSFVLTGNPNTEWADDKLFWPKYGNDTNTLVFNSTFYLEEDDLANDKCLHWNKALWY